MNQVADQVNHYTLLATSHASVYVTNFLALVVLTVLMILFSYKGGRGGIISLLVSVYAGYAIYTVFPYTNTIINTGGTAIVKAIISIIIYAIATYLPFHFVQRLVGSGFGVLSFLPRFVLSFLAACFLLALAYHVFNVSNIYHFSEPLNTLFAPNKYFFWWFIAPLVGMFVLVH